MATTKLGLPTITGNMTADVVRDMNALAESVDAKAGAAGGLARLDANGKVINADGSQSGEVTQEEFSGLEQTVTTHLADDVKHITAEERTSWNGKETPDGALKKIEQTFFKTKKSSKDETTETYTVVEKRREDGTLSQRATFINPNAEGLFQNRKHEWFAADGVTVEKTITTTITYDADGEFLEEA